MESIWDDLSRDAKAVKSPYWHQEILKERENALETGNARLPHKSELDKRKIRKMSPILNVKNLSVSFETDNKNKIKVLDNISFTLKKKSILGIAGESGCGKSVTVSAIMRLLPHPFGKIENGEIRFKDKDIVKLPPNEMHKIRGSKISMIFQEPMTALNPVQKIGRQIEEMFKIHKQDMPKKNIKKEILNILEETGISEPERKIELYPHELSGGMRQRVMIGMAIALKPDILIADEPTTALDVTIQAQILRLIKKLQKEHDMSVIFITHDLGVISEICDYTAVMYLGRIIEKGKTEDILYNPAHPYTKGLIASVPKLDSKKKTFLNSIPGIVPSFFNLPKGCRFESRCEDALDICKTKEPSEICIDKKEHFVLCRLAVS